MNRAYCLDRPIDVFTAVAYLGLKSRACIVDVGMDTRIQSQCRPISLDQGFLTGGKFPPWGKYWEFRGEMRAFENCCLFKTGDTKWFP